MKTDINSVRLKFLEFFKTRGHKILSGSSLISSKNMSLLFTNAGMNQFVDYFLGYKKSNFSRISTSQYCLRVGGKHNDLNNIGYTNYHSTFFEMLGNFSFNDYFKKEAIFYAWELLTGIDNFNLPKDRLLITVYDKDHESYKIWSEDIGIDLNRIILIGQNIKKNNNSYSDNFWQMDHIGPCGPCTEIFYDNTTNSSNVILDSNIINSNRFVEIWNIVFIQFNRDINGSLVPLKVPLVDTGMGLERMVSVLQNVDSVYKINLFNDMIIVVANLIKCFDLTNISLRVIVDHLRSCIFIIQNGIYPSNDKHGYILRKLLRRAIVHGYMLGVEGSFLYKLVDSFIYYLKSSYCLINLDVNNISSIIKYEEDHFSRTLQRGFFVLDKELINLKEDILDGQILFKLYDTYGFPLYLVEEICSKRNISIDIVGFNKCMLKQKNRSRIFNKDLIKPILDNSIVSNYTSVFDGYVNFEIIGKILLIFVSGKMVHNIYEGQHGIIILDRTSFFYESSGQVSDIGFLKNDNGLFKVNYTRKYCNVILHVGILVSGNLSTSNDVYSSIDNTYRMYISMNHSSTHLLHAVLRRVLGDHVCQKGSFINDKYFRFDFSHTKPLTPDELCLIENIVNDYIRKNINICISHMSINKAKLQNVIALFEERYHHEFVRVVQIDNISSEVCLGTHVKRTGDIGMLKIISEKGVSLGIRRIESVTGKYAIFYIQSLYSKINLFMKVLNTNFDSLENKLMTNIKSIDKFKKYFKKIEKDKLTNILLLLKEKIEVIKDINLLFYHIKNIDISLIYKIMNILSKNFKNIIIFLSTNIKGNNFFLFYINKNMNYSFNIDQLINFLIKKIRCKIYFKLNIGKFYIKDNCSINVIIDDIRYWIVNKL